MSGPTDPSRDANWPDPPPRKGFFTDTSICIGCKACEVACKEWNHVPDDGFRMLGSSYDNTGSLGASTWRHVAFIEQTSDRIAAARESGRKLVELGMPSVGPPADAHPAPLRRATAVDVSGAAPTGLPLGGPGTRVPETDGSAGSGGAAVGPGVSEQQLEAAREAALAAQAAGTIPDFRWLIASDVCKHCTHAGCLDVCPTGSLFRTEFGTVVVQDDICNGCGYCVAACPFGVIERRDRPGGKHGGKHGDKHGKGGGTAVLNEGIAQKCTLCYDRIGVGEQPACAKTCPTTSIQFGDLDEMRARAQERVETLHAKGFTEARLYGHDEHDGVGGTGSVFLLLDEPEVYGLPPDPVVTTHDLPDIFRKAGYAGLTMLGVGIVSFATAAATAAAQGWRRG
nr:4Fe-4S dicluster domain-containing protein [Kineosphaera limosa]